jgi:Chaperone of endosialidase
LQLTQFNNSISTKMKTKTMGTLHLRKSIDRSPLRLGFLLISLALACFALSPQARAVCQEGCDLGNGNTFLGDGALSSNTSGYDNTATGVSALVSNTTGYFNTATGGAALVSNTTGCCNTASGYEALFYNTTGINNTATGARALESNGTGDNNTATGAGALLYNSGSGNTAVGSAALLYNTSGSSNTATGSSALLYNTTGSANTAIGDDALGGNTTGNNNTAVGSAALRRNVAGSSNIALGISAGSHLTHGNNNIDIGSDVGGDSESRTIRIGTTPTQLRTFVAGISSVTVAGGVGVIVDTNGQLGTVVSSERFKDGIKPMDKASEAILALKPVTFRYKHELDPKGIPQFGLVAEQVEKVNPDLVARDDEGKPYTVRYDAVNAMLLNEFLKARRQIDAQQKQIDALTAGLQKVSAQLEVSRPAPRTVKNND